jgi:hypothetical protein
VALPSRHASADSVEIQYEITSGALDIISGSTPYTGSGTYSLRYTAAGLNSLLSGPSTLISLNVTQGGLPGIVGVPGTYPTSIAHIIPGSLSVYYGGAANTGDLVIKGYTPCPFTPDCVILTGSGSNSGAEWGPNFVRVRHTYTIGSGLVVLPDVSVFVGQEISRTFVPEPGAIWRLGSGIALLLFLTRRHRQRSVCDRARPQVKNV